MDECFDVFADLLKCGREHVPVNSDLKTTPVDAAGVRPVFQLDAEGRNWQIIDLPDFLDPAPLLSEPPGRMAGEIIEPTDFSRAGKRDDADARHRHIFWIEGTVE